MTAHHHHGPEPGLPESEDGPTVASGGPSEAHNKTENHDSAVAGYQRKAFATLQASFALERWEFSSLAADGCTGPFLATRWGMARLLATMDEAMAFAKQVGVRA